MRLVAGSNGRAPARDCEACERASLRVRTVTACVWDDFRRSDNVEDRRGDGSPGLGGLGPKAGGLGIGTVLVLGLIGWALGIDPQCFDWRG